MRANVWRVAEPNRIEPSRRSLRALDALNFFLSDGQTGIGPFLAVYLASERGWNAEQIGFVLSASAAAGVIAQTPAGALVDRVHRKRELLAIAALLVAFGSVLTVTASRFAFVLGAQALVGAAGTVFPPAVATISLGMVGHEKLDRRVGRNQTLDFTGNLIAALYAGTVGEIIGQEWIFYSLAAVAIFGALAAMAVRPEDIDYELARGARTESEFEGPAIESNAARVTAFRTVFSDRRLLIFFVSILLFHLSNTALVPLISQRFTLYAAHRAEIYTTAAIVVAMLVMIPMANLTGRLTGSMGRKPLLIVGFSALPLRAALFALSPNSYYTISLQIFDGISAAIISVLGVLVVADLTRKTGHFGAMRGALATATAIGVSLSTALAGFIVKREGYPTAFLALAAIGILALLISWLLMPETKKQG